MSLRPRSLSLENLESRLNLSSLGGLAIPSRAVVATKTQEVSIINKYKVITLTDYLKQTAVVSGVKITASSSASIGTPANLAATASSNTITLKWLNQAINQTGFRIYRSTDDQNFSQLATVAGNKTSFSDTTAAMGVTYYYAIAAYDSTAQSALSNIALATRPIPVTAPLAPTAFSAMPVSSSAIALAWKDNASNETGYHIYRSTNGTNYTLVGDLAANSTAFTDGGLKAGTKYSYKVSAWNSGGEKFAAKAVSATTLAAPAPAPAPIVTAPAAPSGVNFSGVTSGSLTVNWTDAAGNVSGYRVYRSTDGVSYTNVANLAATATSYADAGLAASTTYYYQIAAWNAAGETAAAPAAQTTQAPPVIAPSAPTGVTVGSATINSLQVAWTDGNTNETGVRVYRSTDGVNYTQVADLAAHTTSFTDTGLAANTTYYYEVSAWNSAGETMAGAASGTTLAPVAAPAAPGNLSFANVTSGGLTLNWTDTNTNETGVRVYRSTDGVNYAKIADLAANTSTFADSGLAAGTTYYYEVSAWNSAGETFSSAAAQATAAPAVAAPSAPGSVTVGNATINSLLVTWTDTSNNETGFRVYRTTDGVNFAKIADLAANTTSFVDYGLLPGTTYTYKITAWNSAGETAGNLAADTTLSPVAAPAAPGNLSFANVTTGGLTLNWTDTNTNETGARVYRSTDGVNFAKIADLAANTTTFADSGLAAGTTYYYEVSAWNSAGETFSSAAAQATAAPVVAAPAAPGSVTVGNATTTSLLVSWVDSSNELGFHVCRSADGVNFTLVGNVAANATSFTDTGLAAGTTYTYKVSAWNTGGESYAAPVSGATQALVVAPAAPTNLTFANVTSNGATLNWTDVATNESGYRVYRSTDGVNYAKIADLAANTTTYTDSGLAAGTTYHYEVSAWNSAGETLGAPASATTAAPPPPITNGIAISTRNMTSFTELDITGTSGNDSIVVSQSNGILTITADGLSTTLANTFGNIVIHGGGGNDIITVNSSVNIATLIYGGDGNDIIKNLTTGKATIVTIGNGTNSVTGNGINTSFWVNPGDIVNASSAEINWGGVNRVSGWYQPFSTDPANANYIPRGLYGQNLPDPADAGATKRLTANSFWGTGPVAGDINQTSLADCYFMAPLASLANNEPLRLMNMAADLGDGTYAVRFVRNGVTSYVRVGGDLSVGGWNWGVAYAAPGASGNLWGSLFEKAYAFYRTGANTYASLDWGFQSATLGDLGLTCANTGAGLGGSALMTLINAQIGANKAVCANTNGGITDGAPLVASHVYSVFGAYVDSSGTVWIELRNPWGVGGPNNDGLLSITYAQFADNFGTLTYSTL